MPFNQLMDLNSLLQTTRQQLDAVLPRLNKIAALQDELRDCLSPADVKMLQQQFFLLSQQQRELDRRMASHMREIEEELNLAPSFEKRVDNFMDWADQLQERLNGIDGDKTTQVETIVDSEKRVRGRFRGLCFVSSGGE